MRIHVVTEKPSESGEKIGMYSDNEALTLGRELSSYFGGAEITYSTVQHSNGTPIGLKRRIELLEAHKLADLTLIFGDKVQRPLNGWFPVTEAVKVSSVSLYILQPHTIQLSLVHIVFDALEKGKQNV